MRPWAYYEAIATLTGCIIGAGVLGIPYVMVRAGFWTGMLVLIVLGVAALIIHLLTGEVALRTKECHQLVGYAHKYLGTKGKYIMTIAMIVGVYGALVAYTLGVGASLSAIFGSSMWYWSALFYVFMAILLFGGMKTLGRSELYMELLKLVVFVLLLGILVLSPQFSGSRFTGFSWHSILIPYGVILFAYLGTAAIPEVREQTKTCLMLTKDAILFGSLIPIIAYVLFAFAVVGASGAYTTEVATIGLGPLVGPVGFTLLHVFGIVAMASSFVALGFALKTTYIEDFGVPSIEGWALTVTIPAVLMMLGVHSFVRALEVTGTFAGGITGILVVMMHARARKKGERTPEYQLKMNKLGYGILILLFALGMLYQLVLLL